MTQLLSKKKKKRGGFTLAELLVVIFISSLLTTITLFDFKSFTSETVFKNKALDVALAIREVQIYGVGGKKIAGVEDTRYGVYFDNDTYSDNTTTSQFYIFADTNKNNTYDPGEEIETITLDKTDGYEIDDVCLYNSKWYTTYGYQGSIAPLICGDGMDRYGRFYIALLFRRATVAPSVNAGIWILRYKDPERVEIVLKRLSDGATKTITVYNTGGVTVK